MMMLKLIWAFLFRPNRKKLLKRPFGFYGVIVIFKKVFHLQDKVLKVKVPIKQDALQVP